MSKYRVSWPKEQSERAKQDGKGLFAVACLNKRGRHEASGPMNHEMAEKLFYFSLHLCHDATPEEAFAKVFGKGWGK